MNHQPFEEWLLNDKNLTPSETRELDLHLRQGVANLLAHLFDHVIDAAHIDH